MKKKNLLLIVPKIDQGGLERVCVRTARILEPYFHITVAIFDAADPAYDLTGLHVHDLHAPVMHSRIGKVFRVLQRAWRLKKIKRAEKTDIAYSFGPTANRANLASGGPGEIWCGLRSWIDLEKKKELRLVAKKSDRLICCSKMLAKLAGEACSRDLAEVLYNPYRMEELEEASLLADEDLPDWEGCEVLVTLGREDDVKCFWHLLKAFFLLHQRRPQTRFAIVGYGDFSAYKKLAADLGISDAVCFPGRKKNPFPWLRMADLYVAASVYEGFPNAMVEAMALGCPVISTNCMTGPAEILAEDFTKVLDAQKTVEAEYGILLPPIEEEQVNLDPLVITQEEHRMAQTAEALLADPEKLAHFAAAARKRAQVFTEEAYREQFLQIAQKK